MSEQGGRDWTRMTPDDFDRDAELRPAGTAPGAVPAVPDELGTQPLFGAAEPLPPRDRHDRATTQPVGQDVLF
ncbi:hypothetical protein [Streptomyces sp. NPDC049813]|uniref:hypothetical protein n=1 Tax=Streptomyces sp. NPDC049813 TaxID=3365597 RepID=UPI0037B6A94E